MSHANAALTPRARLQTGAAGRRPGLAASLEPRNGTTCPGRPRSGGPTVSPSSGRPGWTTRRRVRTTHRTGPRSRWSARSCTCGWKQRWARSQIADQVGLAPSTVHAVLVRCRLNRLTHVDRVTGEPIRRYEHPHPGSLIHVDVKKLGNVPDGGGWRYVGRHQGRPEPHRHHGPHRHDERHYQPKIGTAFVHTVIDDHSRVAYAEIHDDETAATATAVLRRAVAWFAARGVVVERVLSDNGSRLPRPTCGATPAPSWASPTSGPGPTGPRPTARSNASTAPWPTAGRSRSSTHPNPPAEQLCQHGSTTTTTTGPTPQSAGQHPSAA